jgi:hypothetical protein
MEVTNSIPKRVLWRRHTAPARITDNIQTANEFGYDPLSRNHISDSVAESNRPSEDMTAEEHLSVDTTRPGTNIFQFILRALGLKVISMIREKQQPGSMEHEKVLISRSRSIALGRATIHFLPTLISVFWITLNLFHLVLCDVINTVALLAFQLLAKVHVCIFLQLQSPFSQEPKVLTCSNHIIRNYLW